MTLLYFRRIRSSLPVGTTILFGEELGPPASRDLPGCLPSPPSRSRSAFQTRPRRSTSSSGSSRACAVACLIVSGSPPADHLPAGRRSSSGALVFTCPGYGPDACRTRAREPTPCPGRPGAGLLCAVFVATMIPIGLFYTGVQRTKAGVIGLLRRRSRSSAVLLAYAVLGESLTALQLAGSRADRRQRAGAQLAARAPAGSQRRR